MRSSLREDVDDETIVKAACWITPPVDDQDAEPYWTSFFLFLFGFLGRGRRNYLCRSFSCYCIRIGYPNRLCRAAWCVEEDSPRNPETGLSTCSWRSRGNNQITKMLFIILA